MESFNYNHLFYFWTVARNGSVSRASAELRVSQPTVSEQIGKLEEALGAKLFERAGRGIRLSSAGQLLFTYADRIFRLGQEMREAIQAGAPATTIRLAVGVAQAVPTQVATRILAPILRDKNVQILCAQENPEHLLGRLALRQLDLVLSDSPVPSAANVRAFSTEVASSAVSFVASPKLRLRGKFPRVLDGAPFLMPEPNTRLHDMLRKWLEKVGVRPKIVGEVSGSGMMQTLGQATIGAFAAPTIIERELQSQLRLNVLGRTTALKQDFCAITAERHPANPAVTAILNAKYKHV